MISNTNIRSNIVSIVIIFIITATLIFYQFPTIPHNLSFDEVSFAHLALSLQNIPYTPYSLRATGHATLYFYILLASLKMFGITTFALRLPAALFGVANGLLFFAIMKDVWTKKYHTWLVPLVLTILFITIRWYFTFARFAFEATFLLFLELAALWFFFQYQTKRRLLYLGICGLCAGLAFNSYTPGRIFFLLPGFFLLMDLWKNHTSTKNRIVTALTFIIPLVITILPLSLYLKNNPDIRINQLSYMNNPALTISEKGTILGENLGKTAGMFFLKGDLNGRHNYPGKPAINPLMGLLFIVGLIMSMKSLKKNTAHQLFLGYLVLSLVPALLTFPSENPHMLRTMTATVSVIYFCGVSLTTIVQFGLKKIRTPAFVLIPLMILLSFSVLYELRTYFVYQQVVFEEAFDQDPNLQTALKSINTPKTK